MKGSGSIRQVVRADHCFAVLLVVLISTDILHAQLGQQPPPPVTQAGTVQSTISSTPVSSGTPSGTSSDPFSGSVITEKATDQVISISLKDAINRGLKSNLGALLTEQGITGARAQRWRALQSMLPDVTAKVGENVQQVNLAAAGIRFPESRG